MYQEILSLGLLAASAVAQQPGSITPEVHPTLPSQQCTVAGGCKNVSSSIVLDSAYHWLHSVNGNDSCNSNGGWNTTLCPDVDSCAANCAMEGADYASSGVSTSGNAITLNLFVGNSTPSPRVYLLANDTTYNVFKLLDREFTFDVDASKVPCGINGALYFSEMDGTGNANSLNKAGAKYGTGYCDAQCPTQPFINGQANLNNSYGACCSEMDIWEANSASNAFTPHPCEDPGLYKCSIETDTCGDKNRYGGVCDKDGCDYNSYRDGARQFYGVGKTVDTSCKFTVVTQFLTNSKSSKRTLSEIRRIYVQHGTVILNSKVNIPGLAHTNSITDKYCTTQKAAFNSTDDFAAKGGLAQMGGALGRGMVLAMSIWEDSGSYMLWLDSDDPTDADPNTPGVARGPCSTDSGRPADLAKYTDAAITFSNIKTGEIGSTFKHGK